MVNNFNEFCVAVRECGFSLGGGNNKGIYAIVPFDWTEENFTDSPVQWHTGDPEHDPWEWRMRVLEECDDIAYGKMFFRTGGYISRDWYPYFLAIRRQGNDIDDEYSSGNITSLEKDIYRLVKFAGSIPLHEIKQQLGINKETNSIFDKSMINLQMKMYLTVCGRAQKLNKKGEPYGWSNTVFCPCDEFFGNESWEKSLEISENEAFEKISEQVLKLNPEADKRKIKKFILG